MLSIVRACGALAIAMAALSACGPVPRPFSTDEWDKRHNAFLIVPETAGVWVEPVEGPVDWVGAGLAHAMADALVGQDLVASAAARNRASFVLRSQGYQQLYEDRPAELVLEWVLTDPEGRIVGERTFQVVPQEDFWEAPTDADFRDIAKQSAARVAAWLKPNLQRAGVANLPALWVDPVEGAGAEGNAVLRQTLMLKLKAAGIEVLDGAGADPNALAIGGRVEIRSLNRTTDLVAIVWRLTDASRHEIGAITQENGVPAGTIRKSWLSAAPAIADGAVEGLMPLMRAYARQKAGRAAVTRPQ